MSKEKLYVTRATDDFTYSNSAIWTLSFDPEDIGWVNNQDTHDMGLLKEDAEEIARRYNGYEKLAKMLFSEIDQHHKSFKLIYKILDNICLNQQWEPIETAPKNGERILVFQPAKGKGEVLIAFYNERCESFVNDVPNGSMLTPKYWQPIPKPPKRNDDVAVD